MSEFAGTTYYYSRYRPGLPRELAERLITEANRDAPAKTLLDLGTGTGQVIVAVHHNFEDIIGVDPDAQMLELAERNLCPLISPQTRLRFCNCRSEEFRPPNGWNASLVTICRAFHWMKQERVLEQLAEYVAPTGVVAILGDSSFWDADNQWKKAVRQIIRDFLGDRRRAGEGVFSHHDRPYSEILKESPFFDLEEFTFPVHRTWNTESILGYLYSTSFAARPLFGNRIEEFEAIVKATLAKYSDDDTFSEENAFIVRLGRKGYL